MTFIASALSLVVLASGTPPKATAHEGGLERASSNASKAIGGASLVQLIGSHRAIQQAG